MRTRIQVIIRDFAIVAILGMASTAAMCNLSLFGSPSQVNGPVPSASSSPSPSPSPVGSPTATPAPDPCKPVIGANVSGATEVQIGSIIRFDITPISPAGPLEGALDYCNAARTVTPENVSSNLRCVGSCGGFGPQFLAVAVGPFSVQFRVEGAVSQPFQGTVTR